MPSRILGLGDNPIGATHNVHDVPSAIQRRCRTGKDLLGASLERDRLEIGVQLPGVQIAQVLGILQSVVAADVLGVDVLEAPDGDAFLPFIGALLVFLDGGVKTLDYFIPRDLDGVSALTCAPDREKHLRSCAEWSLRRPFP